MRAFGATEKDKVCESSLGYVDVEIRDERLLDPVDALGSGELAGLLDRGRGPAIRLLLDRVEPLLQPRNAQLQLLEFSHPTRRSLSIGGGAVP